MSIGFRIKQILAMRCDDAAELLSRNQDEPLSNFDRIALASHLFLCRSCWRFRYQAEFLHAAMRKFSVGNDDHNRSLSQEARLRILDSMSDRERNGPL